MASDTREVIRGNTDHRAHNVTKYLPHSLLSVLLQGRDEDRTEPGGAGAVIGKSAAGFSLRVEMEGRFSDLTGSEAAFQASSLTLDSSPGMSRALPSSLLGHCGVGARWTTRPAPASGSGEGDAALTGRSRKEGGCGLFGCRCPVACEHPSLLVASCGLLWPRSGKGDGGACFALLLPHWLMAARCFARTSTSPKPALTAPPPPTTPTPASLPLPISNSTPFIPSFPSPLFFSLPTSNTPLSTPRPRP